MKKQIFAQQSHRILRPVVRESSYEHNPLLINSLAAFNFSPPILLEFPETQSKKRGHSLRQLSTWR